jgi:hypothetical protein
MMELKTIFAELAELPRWVPWRLVFNPKREKFDKIPSNGTRGISTRAPNEWTSLPDAVDRAQEYNLDGVGLVFTGGITRAGWRLVGFDYDKVDFEKFELPFAGYSEVSPSGTGVRAFAWVPEPWAVRFKDNTTHPGDCDHCEVYLGSAPRFLTVTMKVINDSPIPELQDSKILKKLEGWVKPADPPAPALTMPQTPGKAFSLKPIKLTPDQTKLVEGKGGEDFDRSKILHGLLIVLVDEGKKLDDILATIANTPALWQYCLSHRKDDPIKAMDFARDELKRAYERTQRYLRERLIGYNEAWRPDEPSEQPPEIAPHPFPVDLYHDAPGLVGEIAHWILAASFSPREEFAYACALSMVSCLIGPYCTQETRDGKLNLYLTLVGGTGTGKSEAIGGMAKLLSQTDAKDLILDFPASEAALRRQLNITPSVVLRVDEIAHKLKSMENNTNGAGLSRAMLEAYDGARMPPKVYADEKKTLPAVENPYVQIIGGTTDKVWDVVKSAHMEDGTLNRFIFVCLPDKPVYRHTPSPVAEIKKEFKDKLNAFFRQGKRYDLIGFVPPGFGRVVKFGPGVLEALEAIHLEMYEKEQEEFGTLYVRHAQNTGKIACILAVGDGRMEVSMNDLDHAKRFMDWSLANTYRKCSTRMAETHFERGAKRLTNKLETTGGMMNMREAYRFMHISKREMEELIASLVAAGEIMHFIDEDPQPNGYYMEWICIAGKE